MVEQMSKIHSKKGLYELYFKRPMDFLLALFAFVFLIPVFIVLYFIIRKKLGSPVIFTQKRPGFRGEIFTLIKFRTMTDQKDAEGNLLSDEQRMTSFGRKLRASSLDELPELINIIKGDMSIVGPRPLLVQYLPLYTEEQSRRHNVRPGLTGLAQISGRNSIDWQKRLILDVKYSDNVTFIGDWKIIISTIRKVIFREGIHSDTSVTMEQFQGEESSKI